MAAHQIEVRPLHPIEWTLDVLMVPLMWLLQCFIWEIPQRTHRWNNHHLDSNDVAHLASEMMVHHNGNPTATRNRLLFHMPCFGGWTHYVVLRPREVVPEGWYVGWITHDAIGVSRIPLTVAVKVLVGPHQCAWFGITSDGTQIALEHIDESTIGSGKWPRTPVL